MSFGAEKKMPPNSRTVDDGSSLFSERFHPAAIKKAVDSLVFSRFRLQHQRTKAARRVEKSLSSSPTNSGQLENTLTTPSESTGPPQFFYSSKPLTTSTPQPSESVSTCDISVLISHSPLPSTLTLSTTMRRGSSNSLTIYSSAYTIPATVEDSSGSSCARSTGVSEEISGLNTIKEEILKIIYDDDLRKSSTLSTERLEAERLLLMTDTKAVALLSEETGSRNSVSMFDDCGNLEISNLRLWLEHANDDDDFFICMIICGASVKATEVCKVKSNGVVYFNKICALSSLRANDKLEVRVYSISSKICKKPARSCIVCDYRPSKDNPEGAASSRESLFRLRGQTDLKAVDFTRLDHIQIISSGILTATVSSQAAFTITLTGFLNVRDGASGFPTWNKQWAILSGNCLRFFNYPPDQLPGCKPTETIRLTKTCSVRLPTREECSRKHTIFLKVCKRKTVWMSFDLQHEFYSWEKYLKCVISQIKTWEKY